MKNQPTPPTVKTPAEKFVGKCYAFMRDGHDWDCCEVAVLSTKRGRFKVTRAGDLCEALLAPVRSDKRTLKTWTCTRAELW